MVRWSSVLYLGGIPYWLSSNIALLHKFQLDAPEPITVVTVDTPVLTADWLNATITRFLASDDVFSLKFLPSLYVQGPGSRFAPNFTTGARSLIRSYGTKKIIMGAQLSWGHETRIIPEGPYFIDSAGFHPAWRLYEDPLDAFVLSVVPTKDPLTYETLDANADESDVLSVAVPSRLAYTKTAKKPMAGVRVAIKDIYDLKGVKTGGSCRAYKQLYPPRNASAPVVQRLLELGAIVIGKTKTTQFADAESPTADWVDYHCPFNPRADGYQSPAASSAGSGAAMAEYDWVDNALGTDTGGSIRFPAAAQNIFGLRPSHGTTSLSGILPITKYFDTSGYFSRDIDDMNFFGGQYYGDAVKNYTKFPTKIIYPIDWWSLASNDTKMAAEPIIKGLEAFLGVKRTNVNTSLLWDQTSGAGASITTYLNTTFSAVHAIDHYRNYDQFRADYHAEYNKPPYVNPQIQYKWAFGRNQTQAEQNVGLAQKAFYKAWFEKNMLGAEKETCSNAVMVQPLTFGSPTYRDTYGPKPMWSGIGWGLNQQSVFAETPELAIPVGQTPYLSRVSDREEQLPAVVSIMAAKYCDYMVLNLVREVLHASGLPTSVKTGSVAF